jgi:DNA-binding transcriptional regulator YdaS (Cro superfamily)
MAASNSLESLIAQASRKGVKLSGSAKKELTKAVQQSGKKGQGKKITTAELSKGKSTFTKAGGSDYLASVGQTYAANQLSKDLRKRFESKGYTKDNGYYVKPGAISQSAIDKATAAGYDPKDIRATLASNFAQSALSSEAAKFLGETYDRDPNTGTWSQRVVTLPTGTTTGTTTGVTSGSGIYSGIDPDAASGSTVAEINYATMMDPAKLDARLRERLGFLNAGVSQNLSRMQTGSAERLGLLTSQTERDVTRAQLGAQKDIARSQQATDLMGRKMGYGTEYELAKMNRLAGLQQANIQQATSLYNLIPSAF